MRRISRHRFLRHCACLVSSTTAIGLSMAIAEDANIDLQVRCLSATCSGGSIKARIRITNRSPFAIEFLAAGMTCPLEDCAIEVVDKEGNVVFKEAGNTENGGAPSEVIRLPPRGFFETTVGRRMVNEPPDFKSTVDPDRESVLFLRACIRTGKGAGIRGMTESDKVIQTTAQKFLSKPLALTQTK